MASAAPRPAVCSSRQCPSFTSRAAASAPASSVQKAAAAAARWRLACSAATRTALRRWQAEVVAGRRIARPPTAALAVRGAWRRWLAVRTRSEVLVLMDSVAMHFRLVTWQRHAVASRTLAGSVARTAAVAASAAQRAALVLIGAAAARRREEDGWAVSAAAVCGRVQLRRLRTAAALWVVRAAAARAQAARALTARKLFASSGGRRALVAWARARAWERRRAFFSAEGALWQRRVALRTLRLRTSRAPLPSAAALKLGLRRTLRRWRTRAVDRSLGDMLARQHAGYAQGRCFLEWAAGWRHDRVQELRHRALRRRFARWAERRRAALLAIVAGSAASTPPGARARVR